MSPKGSHKTGTKTQSPVIFLQPEYLEYNWLTQSKQAEKATVPGSQLRTWRAGLAAGPVTLGKTLHLPESHLSLWQFEDWPVSKEWIKYRMCSFSCADLGWRAASTGESHCYVILQGQVSSFCPPPMKDDRSFCSLHGLWGSLRATGSSPCVEAFSHSPMCTWISSQWIKWFFKAKLL